MSTDHTRHVVHAAGELCKAMNETGDEPCPKRLPGIVKTHSAIAVGTVLLPIPIIVDVNAA